MQLQEVKLANSGNRVLQATMIEQEANYQDLLICITLRYL